MNFNKFNAIIFDLGGVIININPELSFNKLLKIINNTTNAVDLFDLLKQKNILYDFEEGLISATQFRNYIIEAANQQISNQTIDEAWGAMLVNYPPENIEIIKQLKSKFRTFLFSNTNEIHVSIFNKMLSDQFNIKSLDILFEKVYYSNVLGKRKPKPDGFLHILSESKLNASETLFVDDTLENIETAQKLGIQTFFITKEQTLSTLFNQILLS